MEQKTNNRSFKKRGENFPFTTRMRKRLHIPELVDGEEPDDLTYQFHDPLAPKGQAHLPIIDYLVPGEEPRLKRESKFNTPGAFSDLNFSDLYQIFIKSEITEIAPNTFANEDKISSNYGDLFIHNNGIIIGSRAFYNYGYANNRFAKLENAQIFTQSFSKCGIGGDLLVKGCSFDGFQHFLGANFKNKTSQWGGNLTLEDNMGDKIPVDFARNSVDILDGVSITSHQEPFIIDSGAFREGRSTIIQGGSRGPLTFNDKLTGVMDRAFYKNNFGPVGGFFGCMEFRRSCFEEAFESAEELNTQLAPFVADGSAYANPNRPYRFGVKSFANNFLKPQPLSIYAQNGLLLDYKSFYSHTMSLTKRDVGCALTVDCSLSSDANDNLIKERSFANSYYSSYKIVKATINKAAFIDSYMSPQGNIELIGCSRIGKGAFENFGWGGEEGYSQTRANILVKESTSEGLNRSSNWSNRVFLRYVLNELRPGTYFDFSGNETLYGHEVATDRWLLGWSINLGDNGIVSSMALGQSHETRDQEENADYADLMYNKGGYFAAYHKEEFTTSFRSHILSNIINGQNPSQVSAVLLPDCSKEITLGGTCFEPGEQDELLTDEQQDPPGVIVPDPFFYEPMLDGSLVLAYDYKYTGTRTQPAESATPWDTYNIVIEFISDPAFWTEMNMEPNQGGWRARVITGNVGDMGWYLNQNDDPKTPDGTYVADDGQGNQETLIVTTAQESDANFKYASVAKNREDIHKLYIDTNSDIGFYKREDPESLHEWIQKTNFVGEIVLTGVLDPEFESPE